MCYADPFRFVQTDDIKEFLFHLRTREKTRMIDYSCSSQVGVLACDYPECSLKKRPEFHLSTLSLDPLIVSQGRNFPFSGVPYARISTSPFAQTSTSSSSGTLFHFCFLILLRTIDFLGSIPQKGPSAFNRV